MAKLRKLSHILKFILSFFLFSIINGVTLQRLGSNAIQLCCIKVKQQMILKKISILNFKNIREASLELSPNLNCFLGHNGEGKTNLLDAVYYLSFCRSAFNPVDSQIITHDQDFFVVDGVYENEAGDPISIYCGMKRGTKKHFKRDKKEYKRLSQHIGLVPLIFFSPSDQTLIAGGSEERRRLMDVVISQ